MEYILKLVKDYNKDILIKYKIDTVTKDNECMSNDELDRITNYVNNNVVKNLNNSKYIIVDDKIVGCVVVYDYLDGVLLDELYLENDYTNKGIGSSILSQVIEDNKIVYLWVYKNNTRAVNLYLKMNFKIIEEEEARYFMKHVHD